MYLLPFWISLIIKSFPLLLPSHNIASIMFQCSVFKVHLWIPLSRNSMKPQITFLFFVVSVNLLWWRVPGSNRWPPACKAGALPAELTPHRGSIQKWWAKMDSLSCGKATPVATVHRTVAKSRLSSPFCFFAFRTLSFRSWLLIYFSWSGGPKWTRTIDLTIISRVL